MSEKIDFTVKEIQEALNNSWRSRSYRDPDFYESIIEEQQTENVESCPYCSGEPDQKDLVDEGRWCVWISKNKLVVDMYEGDYVNSLKIPMNYCLNCGRKLER